MKGYCTINSDASVNPATGEAGYALWINCDLVTVKYGRRSRIARGIPILPRYGL